MMTSLSISKNQWKAPVDLRSFYVKKVEGSHPVMISCPFHKDSHPSMAIYYQNAYCFSCGKWEGYYEHLARIGQVEPHEFDRVEEVPVPVMEESTMREMVEQFHSSLFLLNKQGYLEGRGLLPSTIKQYKLGYTGFSYSIPIWDQDSLKTIRFRRDDGISKEGSKYWGIRGINSTFLSNPRGIGGHTTICEGEFDTLIAIQAGANAICLTNGVGGTYLPYRDRFRDVERITIAIDQDRAGYGRSMELAQFFREMGKQVGILRWREKDLTEFYLSHGMESLRIMLECH